MLARFEDPRYSLKAPNIDQSNNIGSEAHLDALFSSAMGEDVLPTGIVLEAENELESAVVDHNYPNVADTNPVSNHSVFVRGRSNMISHLF